MGIICVSAIYKKLNNLLWFKIKESGNTLCMKKISLILCMLLFLFGMFAFLPVKPTVLFDGDVEVFYSYPVDTDLEWIELGAGRLVFCQSQDLKSLPQDYFAISISVSKKDWQLAQEFFSVTVVKEESCEEFSSCLCYSQKLTGGVMIDGQKVNMQVAQNSQKIKIGFPLIVGSF